MNEYEWLRRLDRVSAPADFEVRVGALLARRRATRVRDLRSQRFRYALAGAAASLLAVFVLINAVFLRPGAMARLAERRSAEPGERLSVMEAVDYRSEARSAALRPGTVFILENVSYASDARIRY